MQRLETSGKTYGRLTIISDAPSENRRRKVSCRCACGETKTILLLSILSGRTKSCGCLRKEALNRKRVDGLLFHQHPLYRTWLNMKRRCYYPKCKDYKYYGGKGIRIAPEWLDDFPKFVSDMGPKPTPKHSLDRISPADNYGPKTCRWATDAEQRNNMSSCIYITWGGATKTATQWAEHFGIKSGTVQKRIASGWDPVLAITTRKLAPWGRRKGLTPPTPPARRAEARPARRSATGASR